MASSLLIDMLIYSHLENQQVNTQDIRDEITFSVILLNRLAQSHILLHVRVMQQHVFGHTIYQHANKSNMAVSTA